MEQINQEIAIRFGTQYPIPFRDGKTGMNVYVRANGSARVVVKDPAKYTSPDDVESRGKMIAVDQLMKAVESLSGTVDAMSLQMQSGEIARSMSEGFKEYGLEAAAITIMQIGPDAESVERLKKTVSNSSFSAAQLNEMMQKATAAAQAASVPKAAAAAQAVSAPKASAAQDSFPKFCQYCGAKAGSRFCPECGKQLV